MNKISDEILIRNYQPEDFNWIMHSWLKSYRYSLPAKIVSSEIYFNKQAELIINLINNPDVKFLIAADPQNSLVTYGYLCLQQDIIHYIYVKYVFRKLQVATTLLSAAQLAPPFVCTHVTQQAHRDNVIYNPYLLGVHNEPTA